MSISAPTSSRGTGKNWTPADEELRCVRQMTAAEKLPYSVGAIADNDGFWCAFEDDFYVVYGYKGKKLLPIWPARKFAEEALSKQTPVDIRWVSIDSGMI